MDYYDYLDRPLGKNEVAELLGYQLRTIHIMTNQREQMPPPDAIVSTYPAWSMRTILLWALKTGRIDRLPPEDQERARGLLEAQRA